MTQYTMPKDAGNKASEMMWDVAYGGAGVHIHCDCGIDWQDEDAPMPDEDDEIDDWENVNYFRYIELDGKTLVEECEGCQVKLARYEKWIWNNRELIRDYLSVRVNQEFKWAEQEKLLNTIAGIK